MRTIMGSSGRDCVLFILLQLYGTKAEFFEGDLFWLIKMTISQPSYWKNS